MIRGDPGAFFRNSPIREVEISHRLAALNNGSRKLHTGIQDMGGESMERINDHGLSSRLLSVSEKTNLQICATSYLVFQSISG